MADKGWWRGTIKDRGSGFFGGGFQGPVDSPKIHGTRAGEIGSG